MANPTTASEEHSARVARGSLQFFLKVASYPVRYWNWKAAAIGAAIRSVVFLLAVGHRHAAAAALVEAGYVILTSGFFSAIQQGFLKVKPRWLANLAIVAAVPLAAQIIDSLVHIGTRTPCTGGAFISVTLYCLLSSTFHLHIMRSGAMLTGVEAQPFLSDLKQIPRLLITFVTSPFRAIASLSAGFSGDSELETSSAD